MRTPFLLSCPLWTEPKRRWIAPGKISKLTVCNIGGDRMAGKIEKRLQELGIELPPAPAPVASYVPFVVAGNLVFISGQVPIVNGEVKHAGRIGEGLSLEDGQAAARIVALNLIAQVKEACGGDLDKVVRVVKLGGFVNCTPDFTDHPKIINGASDLIGEVFGEKGAHARFAVGVTALPLGCSVEIEAVFEIA